MSASPHPETVGRYRITGELGRGAMGRVYRAHDPHTDRTVALKVLALAGDRPVDYAEEARTRFLLEARAAGRLSHPGIVLVYDADVDAESGAPFLAMEIVAGRSLSQILREQGPLPWRRAATIAVAVAEALDHAHSRSVVHRDLKPANVLLGDDGAIKVSDFGVAKLVDESHTLTGTLLGTPSYMAPEQIRSEPIDGRADLYSLGAVLYEMLTGEPPFRAETLIGVAHKVVHVDPRPPSFACPGMPLELERVVLRALAKQAEQRFSSGRELAAALRAALGPAAAAEPEESPTVVIDRPADETPAGVTPRARPAARRAAAAGVVVALVAVALAAGLWLGRRGAAPASPATAEPPPVVERETAPPAEVELELPPTPPPADVATLEIRFVNRIQEGWMSIWIDGEPLWSKPLSGPGNPLRRLGGDELALTLPVAAGEREIEVRIANASERIDARGVIRAELAAGASRTLRVVRVPFRSKLRLKWED